VALAAEKIILIKIKPKKTVALTFSWTHMSRDRLSEASLEALPWQESSYRRESAKPSKDKTQLHRFSAATARM
jgi:hypothetical protein